MILVTSIIHGVIFHSQISIGILIIAFFLLQMGKGVPVTINSVAQAADSYMKTAGVSS